MDKDILITDDLVTFVHSKESGVFDDKGNLTNFGALLISIVCISLAFAILDLKRGK